MLDSSLTNIYYAMKTIHLIILWCCMMRQTYSNCSSHLKHDIIYSDTLLKGNKLFFVDERVVCY